jgi:hypothetical protein
MFFLPDATIAAIRGSRTILAARWSMSHSYLVARWSWLARPFVPGAMRLNAL